MNNWKKATIKSEKALSEWLRQYQIPLDKWGHGEAKTVAALWQEIAAGEAELWAEPLLRVIQVVKMKVKQSQHSNLVLMEVEQVLSDGRRRARNQIPGEKILDNEPIKKAALRGLYEELGIEPAALQFVHIPEEPEIEERESPSFPGLQTQYRFYEIEVEVRGLPEETFWTEDLGKSGVKRHRWDWVNEKGTIV